MLYDRCGIPSTCKEICEFATKINLVDSLLRPSSNKSERHYSLGYRKYFKLHDMSTLETQSIMKCKRKNDIEDYEVGRYDRMNSRYKEFSIEIDGEKRSCKHED
uniref:Dimer_Tnp_hAT domain-containing protein n=1 Tax=Parastrongyloides trichosuri TaxID=131310 RepID=A0A0N4ZPY9_PARTI